MNHQQIAAPAPALGLLLLGAAASATAGRPPARAWCDDSSRTDSR